MIVLAQQKDILVPIYFPITYIYVYVHEPTGLQRGVYLSTRHNRKPRENSPKQGSPVDMWDRHHNRPHKITEDLENQVTALYSTPWAPSSSSLLIQSQW